MNKKKAAAGDASTGESRFSKMVKIADIALKLTPAVATGLAAWIAYDYQARSAGVSLLNQREQAETELRSSMFSNLIGPIAGTAKDQPLGVDQQRILVELLTLNFHEHVELKPLLLSADKRLRDELKPESAAEAGRRSLRSVVRRVLDRQLAVLQKDCPTAWAAIGVSAADNDQRCREQPDLVRFCESDPPALAENLSALTVGGEQCLVISSSGATAQVGSPDGRYTLSLAVQKSQWDLQTFDINVLWSKDSKPVNAAEFNLSRYDLPFTDNTILDRDHRFALVIKDAEKNAECATLPSPGNAAKKLTCNILNLWVVWFPPRYILPHERPINFQEIRKILDLDSASH